MATMSQSWFVFTVVTVLAVQLCTGENPCVIWSSAGLVVQRYSSFEVFCTFQCNCRRSMYSGDHPTQQSHKEFNSTTIYFKVANITKKQTYSCKCDCTPAGDSCGLDISVGYPPDRPKNISCTYTVKNDKGGNVSCTWDQGRYTYLRNTSLLWVSAVSENHADKTFNVSSKGTVSPTTSFTVASSVQLITVRVQTQNQLGSAESTAINFTLSDIAKPSTPNLSQPQCSSRECVMHVKQSVRTQHLQIQYKEGNQEWTSYPEARVQISSTGVLPISSLEPCRLYHFRVCSKFSTGYWSEWSTSVSSQTQEEAPAKEMDVWYAEPAADFESLRVYWKEMNISITRGKITEYKVRVYSPNSNWDYRMNISADARSYLVPFCADCEVIMWACNSKGLSPPARITTRHREEKPLEALQVTANNHSATISWRKPETALRHVAYVVEWYPEGCKLEELRWVKLGRNDNHAVITDLRPFECYEGAVYVVCDDRSVSRTRFTGVTTWGSVPIAGPSVMPMVEGNQVIVTWTQIPRSDRGGCITNYTIYLESDSGDMKLYFIPASERRHIIKDLSPGLYSLWMTASTAEGQGPKSGKLKFIIQQTQIPLFIVCVFISVILLLLLCLYQVSAVKRRLWVFFQCLMLSDVPDPANSKWAKECTQEKGKMNLQLEPSLTGEEEEPILVDVEELPELSSDVHAPTNISTHLQLRTNLSPMTEPATVLYPLTTYIKSFSHDSDSSKHTQTSLDTNTTIDYISSHGLGNMDEEDQEEDDEEEFVEMDFFPSQNIVLESLKFGGKLTLDAVKIDCNEFFQNNF